MDRNELTKAWDEARDKPFWWTAWSKAFGGLTPAQAAWKPETGRHSIWDIANHLIFWREYIAARSLGASQLPEAEIDRRNWTEPDPPSDEAWSATLERLAEAHVAVRDALADPTSSLEHLPHLLAHDNYHVGQVMYLRAMQGLPPIE